MHRMDQSVTALERAFQLARMGTSIEEIRRRLKKEGYSDLQVTGSALSKQLRALIEKAKASDRTT